MSGTPVSRSPDILRLKEEGYHVQIVDGYLIVRDVPYLNSAGIKQLGILVTNLSTNGNQTIKPDRHEMWFSGEMPHKADGNPFNELVNGGSATNMGGIATTFSFSQKPPSGSYDDYFEKVDTYASYLVNQVKINFPKATAKTFPAEVLPDSESVFNYDDANASSAQITDLSEPFKEIVVGIIGLGGTGSYVLDNIAKCPVRGIKLVDGDHFHTKNAFRAPGAPSLEKLQSGMTKVDYFAEIYSNMHRSIEPIFQQITEDSVEILDAMDFVFICVDNGSARSLILRYLSDKNIPFIDVGMGVDRNENGLSGMLRVTTSSADSQDHTFEKGRVPFQEPDQDEYSSNIQIADLNALNAALAVIRWKKLYGFYSDLIGEHHLLFATETNAVLNAVKTKSIQAYVL